MDWTLAIERNAAALRRILLTRPDGKAFATTPVPAKAEEAAADACQRLWDGYRDTPGSIAGVGEGTYAEAVPQTAIARSAAPLRRPPPVTKPGSVPRARLLGAEPFNPLFRRPPEPAPPPPPTPEDPLDAARIHGRLGAIGRALDDLPGEALRFARWQALRDARLAREREGDDAARELDSGTIAIRSAAGTPARKSRRIRRTEALRMGRPPGWRRRPTHEVHEVLKELHSLAVWSRDGP
jgi:hypothetical protein